MNASVRIGRSGGPVERGHDVVKEVRKRLMFAAWIANMPIELFGPCGQLFCRWRKRQKTTESSAGSRHCIGFYAVDVAIQLSALLIST